jgi:integrase
MQLRTHSNMHCRASSPVGFLASDNVHFSEARNGGRGVAEDDRSELVPVIHAAAELELTELEERARSFARDSRSPSTWRAYDSDFADFRAWCANQHPPVEPLPATPATVALYLTALAEVRKPSTIRRRLASISVAHQVAGFETPTADPGVRAVWSGIRRRQGIAPRKMRAARTKVITAMVGPLGDGLADARDRTLLLFGFAGALRRSELVALDIEDISEDDSGLRLVLRRSKTDQEAEGATRGLPYGSHAATLPCPGLAGLDSGLGHRNRPGLPGGQPARPDGSHAPQRPGRGRHGQTSSSGRRPRRRLRRPLPTGRLRHRGLRPRNPRTRHHAPRTLALRRRYARLRRRGRPLERQRCGAAGAVAVAAVSTITGILMLWIWRRGRPYPG